MIEVLDKIYVGNEQDYYSIAGDNDWAILHCCKNPFHLELVGYKGNLISLHPDYSLKRVDNRMALNLVDMDKFNPTYLDFNHQMFNNAFSFLDEYRLLNKKLLIHCNQGESRGPSLGLLYISRLGKYDFSDFNTSELMFRQIYPHYNPKQNIYQTVKSLWSKFI